MSAAVSTSLASWRMARRRALRCDIIPMRIICLLTSLGSMAGPSALVAEKSCGSHAVIVKSVLVTGASTGIGRACALRLDRLGHRVYAGVRTQEHAKQLSELGSDRLVPLLLDVTNQAQIEDAAARIGQDGDGLAGVVNNAGIGLTGPIEYLPVDTWRQQLDVNVIGQVAVTKAMLPLIRSGSGR